MVDPRSQLEKMGRELKCPICLSLLSSAVSLTCNHVFCNACILKSMKSGSNCPVCKVPFRRREVRAAPHMDNLVSIYKSMEVASGVNIFVTQNEPPTKSLDKEMGVKVDPICDEQVIGGICHDKEENQGTTKSQRLRRTTKCDVDLSGPVVMKPSCPTKKRIQVAKYPLPETPKQPAKYEAVRWNRKKEAVVRNEYEHGGEFVKTTCNELKESSVRKENPVLNKEGPVLTPFFWLREEEVEKSSQHTEGDVYITPPDVPSFSDLKDSDDKSSDELSLTVDVRDKCNGLDFFDSEIFEWTQRACSPELLPSPVKTQVVDTDVEAGFQGAEANVDLCNENAAVVNTEQGNGKVAEVYHNVSSPRNINANTQIENGKLNRRGRRAEDITSKKHVKKDKILGSGAHAASKEESVNFVQKQIDDSNGNSLIMEKPRSKRKSVGMGICTTKPRPENVLAASVRTEIPDQSGRKMVSDMCTSSVKKQGIDEGIHLKKTGKKCRKINGQSDEDRCTRSKRKVDSTEVNMLEKISIVQNQTDGDTILQSSLASTCVAGEKKTFDLKEKPNRSTRKVKSALNSEYSVISRCNKRTKVASNDISKDGLVKDNDVRRHSNKTANKTRSLEEVQGVADVRALDDLSRENHLETDKVAFRKCETLAQNIHCSFCHSSEASEASGEMVHYHNGRPVYVDSNNGSKIIHSHRNCTEWAPNVYFEDDTAINLEAELARSRRIKCCCCGLKGAALGCYEKSCRKSFHFPCAKLISQCRWDTDNFVMLCPLHASSKLPNEHTGSQESRKKSISKTKSHGQHNQVPIKNDIVSNYTWHSSQNKLVLCCSALTDGEKEIVCKFEKVSKLTVLKKWDSSVTHVIASTDENGACRRTLKYLMGILEGKWILNIDWVKACMKAMKPVDEVQYEITIDVHGMRDGPRLGRLRVQNKEPKIFYGLQFYLMGGFVSSYKGYLQDIIIAAGGTILHRKPISRDQGVLLSGSFSASTFIIYSRELPDNCDASKKDMILNCRQSEAEVLASSTGAKGVSNFWVLNSVAACRLQSYDVQ